VKDDVDLVVEAWRRERPDLDTTPLQVLSRVTRLALHLDRARRAAFAAFGLEPWEFDVLAALRRSGGAHELSPSALTAATLVTSGTMTNRIDRLVERGLVERHPDPADRRGVLVRLAPEGAHRVDAALADLLARERRVLAALTPDQAASLARHLRELLVPFED
jgi:DNA-binding MarR family transcriptional regulator